MKNIIFLILILSSLVSCSSVDYSVYDGETEVNFGLYDDALKLMKPKVDNPKSSNLNDTLIFRLNLAMVYHYKGDYKLSNDQLEICQRIIDYGPMRSEAEAILGIYSNKFDKFYLEVHEILAISSIKALNSLYSGEYDNALAEMRKQYKLFELFKSRGLVSDEMNSFNLFLTGLLYEMQKNEIGGSFDNARISYEKAIKTDSLKNNDTLYKSLHELGQNKEEIIIIHEIDLSARKRTMEGYKSIPQYYARMGTNEYLEVSLEGQEVGKTETMFSPDKMSIEMLKNKVKGQLAYQKVKDFLGLVFIIPSMGTVAGVGVLGDLIKNNAFGENFVDMRAWEYLPQRVQFLRVKAKVGKQVVSIKINNYTFHTEVNVKKGKTVFCNMKLPNAYYAIEKTLECR